MKGILNTLKLSRKSDRKEFLLYLKLTLAGIGLIGAIGFMVQLIASVLSPGQG